MTFSMSFYVAELLSSLFGTDQDNTPIFIGVGVPAALLVLLLITILLLRRRRSAHRKATDSRNNDNMSLPDSVIVTR